MHLWCRQLVHLLWFPPTFNVSSHNDEFLQLFAKFRVHLNSQRQIGQRSYGHQGDFSRTLVGYAYEGIDGVLRLDKISAGRIGVGYPAQSVVTVVIVAFVRRVSTNQGGGGSFVDRYLCVNESNRIWTELLKCFVKTKIFLKEILKHLREKP